MIDSTYANCDYKYTKTKSTSSMYWNGFVFYDLYTKTCYDTYGNIVTDHIIIKRAERDYLYGRSVYRRPDF